MRKMYSLFNVYQHRFGNLLSDKNINCIYFNNKKKTKKINKKLLIYIYICGILAVGDEGKGSPAERSRVKILRRANAPRAFFEN